MFEKFNDITNSYINGQKSQAYNQYEALNDYEKESFLQDAKEKEDIDILYFIAYKNI